MSVYKIKVSKISCSNCAMTITKGIKDKYPEADVRVSVVSNQVFVQTDQSLEQIKSVLKSVGYPADDDNQKSRLDLSKYDLPISVLLAIPLLYGMVAHIYVLTAFHFLISPAATLVFATVIQFYIGRRYYIGAYNSLKKKMLGMDFLVVFSTTVTYFYSLYLLIKYGGEEPVYFEVAAIIITVVLIGKTIESRVKDKTNDLVSKLTELTNDQVRVRDGSFKDINFTEIGTEYVVNPHEKINMDGVIIEGSTSVDEAMLTGESNFVSKTIGDEVTAGTLNQGSQIIVKTTKLAEDNYINQIINSVEEASLIDTKFQKIADKVATIFVPVILLLGLITLVATYIILGDFSIAFEHAMAVIVVSCPCSLGLATPTSIMVSNSISAKQGILYKGAKFFELADKLDVVAFDKTGTLTTGKMEVVKYQLPKQYEEMLYAVEIQSTHPISTALVNFLDVESTNLEPEVTQVPGLGIQATIGDDQIVIGSSSALSTAEDLDFVRKLEEQALTVSVIIVNDEFVGYYAMRDQIKDESKQVIKNLKELGIEPVLISGDNARVVEYVAKELDINKYYSKCKPEDKTEILKSIKEDGHMIGFVGDGINDSISLKYADVGISVSEGSDVATAASDVTLLKDDLNLVVEGIKISTLTRRNIKHNFVWAFSYNLVAIPLAAFGQLNMIWAAIFMGFSSIIVVLNALHLKREYAKRR